MNITEVLQNENALILIKSQDIPVLAEVLANHYRSNQEQTTVKEPKVPISQSEAMKRFNRSRQTFVKWRKKGLLKGFLIGGRVYFEPEELDALQRIKRA